MRRLFLLSLLFPSATFLGTWCVITNAFQHVSHYRSMLAPRRALRPDTSLFGMMRRSNNPGDAFNSNNDDDDAGGFDVEAAREKLEELVVDSAGENMGMLRQEDHSSPPSAVLEYDESSPSFVYYNGIDVTLPTPPPLTAIDRERREAEIDLLRRLDQGDAALTELWTFWFQERGPIAGGKLFQAEELTGLGPRGWPEAEQILTELIEEYSVYWVEPVNRLATLYFMQGRFEDAEVLCKMVLAVKPWHFGALSGIVMVYAGMQDPMSARQWAARRLPTFAPTGNNRRRLAWVHDAVEDAQRSLMEAEERVRKSFGKPDTHIFKDGKPRRSDIDSFDDEDEEVDNVWQ